MNLQSDLDRRKRKIVQRLWKERERKLKKRKEGKEREKEKDE